MVFYKYIKFLKKRFTLLFIFGLSWNIVQANLVTNLVTYSNKKFLFSVNYPSNWSIKETPISADTDLKLLQIVFIDSKKNEVSIKIYPEKYRGFILESFNIFSQKEIMVGDIQGIQFNGIGHKSGSIPLFMYFITYRSLLFVFEGHNLKTLNKIVYSFVPF